MTNEHANLRDRPPSAGDPRSGAEVDCAEGVGMTP